MSPATTQAPLSFIMSRDAGPGRSSPQRARAMVQFAAGWQAAFFGLRLGFQFGVSMRGRLPVAGPHAKPMRMGSYLEDRVRGRVSQCETPHCRVHEKRRKGRPKATLSCYVSTVCFAGSATRITVRPFASAF
jgi:hypothetical protein